MKRLEVAAEADGRRIDRVLAEAGPRALVMKWIRTGAVRRNGSAVAGPGERVAAGDVIELDEGEPRVAATAAGGPGELSVLYEDAVLLVVDKPAGLACHPGTLTGADSLFERVAARLRARGRGEAAAGLAQRLDRGVSGVVPFGIGAESLRALARAVESGAARKTYVALVHGVVGGDEGVVDVRLRVTDQPMGDRPRTVPDPIRGLRAVTRYSVARRFSDATLLEVEIETGRTHQIRAHLLHLGHPILGDPRYGDAARNARLRETFGVTRPLLHAARLLVPHPATGAPVDVAAPLPADMTLPLK